MEIKFFFQAFGDLFFSSCLPEKDENQIFCL
jgi:hypothetical protein